jgi:serine/threonine-protein kinase
MSTRCTHCSASIPDGGKFCPGCGQASRTATPDRAVTRTSAPDRSGVISAGSSAPASDGARFAAGTMIANRYRIVGLLGRGGMGEVYRADDLKLGRTVALKFLPEAMERDPGRLHRFLNEVRTAVRVTHPNVCRVHDVGEVGGRHYLTMEYVDGEDLGTLLRRIGRLPGERAARAARQLCAGIAAAHEQGVLHRDLKPANVMIDGRGEVKITDFGLAGAIGQFDGDEIRAGTPAYMAPEQLQGREVSVRSDLYALGLVLYEMFSGKPAFPGTTPEAIARRSETPPSSLTSVLDDVDPAVARVVDRCLSTDPQDRPASAVAILAALPGGDPLAAALAAGETPSPQLVAEAGASGGLGVRWAWTAVAAIVVLIGIALPLMRARTLVSRVDLDRPPAVLEDRAHQILRSVGYGTDVEDRNHAWFPDWALYQHVRQQDAGPEGWDELAGPRPVGLLFGYRESPRPLSPGSQGSVGNWLGDPPMTVPGMTAVWLTPSGSLRRFRAVPPSVDPAPTGETIDGADADLAPGGDGTSERAGAAAGIDGLDRAHAPDGSARGMTTGAPEAAAADATSTAPDWSALFAAAELDAAAMTPATPRLRVEFDVDRRYAWTGVYPERPDVEIRVEAASRSGRPVAFSVIEPWAMPTSDGATTPLTFWERASRYLQSAWFVVVIAVAGVLAFRNVRHGRGDHRTALRFGLYLGAVRLLWMLDAHDVMSAGDTDGLVGHLAWSAYRVCLSYVFYMALEPYARRIWPGMLVSWMRVFSGRFHDPRVGRDILIGVLFGSTVACLDAGVSMASSRLGIGDYGLWSEFWSWESLRGIGSAIAGLAGVHAGAVIDYFIGIMMFLVLRMATRRTWIAVTLFALLGVVLFHPGSGPVGPYLIVFTGIMVLFFVTLFRGGLLPVILGFSVSNCIRSVHVTPDVTAWYALPMVLALIVIGLLVVWGLRATLAGRRPFHEQVQGPGG